jgi:MoaA/NifB/PqqE/SkfB family radical SAM enzyme
MARMFYGYSGDFMKARDKVSSLIARDNVRAYGKKIFMQPEYLYTRYTLSLVPWNRIIKFPPAVIVEATNHCNLKCSMCVKEMSSKETRGYLDEEIFNNVLEEVGRWRGVRFGLCSNRGESMLHPEYMNYLKRAREAVDGLLYTMTNATRMVGTVSAAFVDMGLDEIEISVDGARKETYEKIRTGASYDNVLANIKELLEIRRRKGRDKPTIMIRTVIMEETLPEMKEYLSFWNEILEPYDYISLQKLMSEDVDSPGIELRKSWEKYFEGRRTPPCRDLWKCLMVRWNGEINLCDSMHDASLGLAENIMEKSIEEVWRGKKLQSIRRQHLRGIRHKIPSCANCHCSYSFL